VVLILKIAKYENHDLPIFSISYVHLFC